jgi:molybdate transport system substrate-binding protein
LPPNPFHSCRQAPPGAQALKVFERLGIADEMKIKTKAQTTPAAIPQAVANGEAELAVFLINVLAAPGVDVVGPLPAPINPELIFAAALAAGPSNAVGAKTLVDFLRTPAAAQVIEAKGMESATR